MAVSRQWYLLTRQFHRTEASLEQCSFELREAEALYRAHGVPVVNSATRSVEEMSTVILQQLTPRRFP